MPSVTARPPARIVYDPTSVDHRRRLAASLIKALETAGFSRVPNDNPAREQVWYRYLFTTQGRKQHKTRFLVKVCTSVVFEGGSAIVRSRAADAVHVLLAYKRLPDREGPREITLATFRVHRSGFLDGIPKRVIERARSAIIAGKGIKRCPWCKTAPLARSKKGRDFCADACWLVKEDK